MADAGKLEEALRAWIAADARARIGGDRPELGWLRGPRGRELFEEARERGALDGDELRAAAHWLREVHLSVGRSRASARVAEALGKRVPHDSDHHAPLALFARMALEAHRGRRRAMARSLETFAIDLLRALREGIADVEESAEGAAWLSSIDAWDRAPELGAAALLDETEELFAEALARAAHGSGDVERWEDVIFLVRGGRFDPLYERRHRFRRIADGLAAVGVREALGKRARVEPERGLSTDVVALEVPRDVRIVPSALELGAFSEREATIAIGRAASIAWRHPALSPLVASIESSVGPAIGALFAHLACDGRASELDLKQERAIAEHALLVELFELRTEAAAVLGDEDALRRAWRADVERHVAACALHGRSRLRALRWAAPLYVVLRERYDEDWWRNPRAAEPLRAGSERAPLTVEAWCAELGADPSTLGPRYRELVR